jgi:hypothetical protein
VRGEKSKMREHLKVFTHTALVIIGLEPTTNTARDHLRGLKGNSGMETGYCQY